MLDWSNYFNGMNNNSGMSRFSGPGGTEKESCVEYVKPVGEDPKGWSRRLDAILLHPVYSYLIFGAALWLLFTLTFRLGALPMAAIQQGVDLAHHAVARLLPQGFVRDLLSDGVVSGVGGVLLFLPNIMILFFGLSVMEETGYMARAAWIMDRVMHKMGLHGRSFVPMIMGFGCNVPAMLAARSIPSAKDRILTILIAPCISCSARLPIYVLFAGAFFPAHAGSVVFSMYCLSFGAAFGLGFLFRKTLFRGSECQAEYVLPPYRVPRIRSALSSMWDNAKHYLNRIGTVVLFFSVLLYLLGHFPASSQGRIEDSYIGKAGRLVEPLLKPAGFDLKLDISLIAGFAAKEMVVGTLGVLYSADPAHGKERLALQETLARTYDPLVAFCFMLFCLLYTPCVASLVTQFRELHNWGWSLFGLFYPLTVAWVAAVLVRQVALLLGGS